MKLSNILAERKKLINDQITKEDIFILIEDIFHLERYEIIMKKDIELDESKILPLFERLKSEPISYILNKRTFDQHEFYVDSRVLIPRDETEELVYLVKKEIEKNKLRNITVLDMGTGSGCIAISLDLYLQNQNIPHRVIACDKMNDALEVAKINNQKNGSNVDFFIACAIAQIESNYSASSMLNKNNIFGGMSNGSLIKYKNIEYGILRYIKLLNDGYFNKGLTTIETIGKVYNPTYNENGIKVAKPSWVKNVTKALDEYTNYDIFVDISVLNSLKNVE